MFCKVVLENVELNALLDTGSDITLLKESEFYKLKTDEKSLHSVGFTIAGLGSEVETKGFFVSNLSVNDIEFSDISIYIVSDRVMRPSMVIGMNLLSQAEITIMKNSITIKKINNSTNEIENNDLKICETENNDFSSFVIDTADFPEVNHIKNDNVKTELYETISNYSPRKIRESPVAMKITLLSNTPVYHPPRRLPQKEKLFVEKQIAEWLQDGIIRNSYSNYASPIVIVKKKDGNLRLCVDYRNLNKIIYRDLYPIPNVEDQIDQLYEANFFSTLDLQNGFLHVPVESESIKFTAFVTPSGHYEFLRMPFGLCNSPSTFQRYIVAIFREYIAAKNILIYIDDIIIPSETEEEGLTILKDVLQLASEYGLEIKWKKCSLLQTEIEYLGYIISKGKIKPSPNKIKAVLNFPEPKTIRQLQSFLGLAGYFRKFIENFAIIARPLSDMLRKNSKVLFDEECRKSFQHLKECLAKKPVLSIFRPGATTELHTDACALGYGAVLFQINQQDNQLHPVSFMSRKTTPAEQNYNSYELEVLAVVEAVKKYRIYLLGHPFKIVTDCQAFTLTLKKKDLTTRVARWILLLEEFEYTVEHRKGTRLKHVDALSRNPISMIITADDTILKQLQKSQQDDDALQAIITLLNQGPYKNFTIHNGLLCKHVNDDNLYVVPQSMEDSIIKRVHNQGHFNFRKMHDIIKKEFIIKNLKNKVEKCVKNCIECILATRKEGRQEGYLHPIPKNDEPLDTFHIDHLGPLAATAKGYKYIFSIIDAFTKFIWLFPVKTLSADEAIKKLKIISETFGNPQRIIADQGGAFIANDFKDYCEDQRIQLLHTTAGVPRGNGQIERAHRIVIATITKLSIDEPAMWYKNVKKVQKFLNSTYQRSICMTPFKLLTGVEMKMKENTSIKEIVEREFTEIFNETREESRQQAKAALLRIQEENKKTFNKKRKPPKKYKVGDLVAIERTQFGTGLKTKAKFLGPYEVIKVKGNDRYEVKKVGKHEGPSSTSISVDKMKPWSTNLDYSDESSEADDSSDGRE